MKAPLILIACLLAAQPLPLFALTQKPTSEFEAGATEKFFTRGHPKASGTAFTISYPKSWAAADGDRPDVIRKLVSDSGRGMEQVLITATPLPADMALTPQKIEELLSPAGLKQHLPKGATFIRTNNPKVANEPAGILEYSTGGEKAKDQPDIHTVSCFFVQGLHLVEIQFRLIGSAYAPSDLRTQLFLPLWDLMIGSIQRN